jgi:hypothetical protein
MPSKLNSMHILLLVTASAWPSAFSERNIASTAGRPGNRVGCTGEGTCRAIAAETAAVFPS